MLSRLSIAISSRSTGSTLISPKGSQSHGRQVPASRSRSTLLRWLWADAATRRWSGMAEQGQVTAVFDVARDHPARALLAAMTS
jgi:hypothetical protein